MTPSEKIAIIEAEAIKHPHKRIGSVMQQIRIQEKAEELKRASEPKFKVLQIAEELRALARQERAA